MAGAGCCGAGAAGAFCCGAFCCCVVGGFTLSRTVLACPPEREAMIASVNEVTMNRMAAPVVALDSTVADPRGPKAVCDPMPPNAPARSAALPLCSKTTITRKKQTRM